MHLYRHYHYGLDVTGQRCERMKSASEIRRCRQQQRLLPRIVIVSLGCGQEVWRNGMHKRNWQALAMQVRADRRCFLTTLRRPPLIPPIPPSF